MALLKARPSDIPADAVRLTEKEAIEYQAKVLNDWKNLRDVFAFKYGPQFLCCASAFVGMYFNSYFRNKYRLINYGRLATYLPACVIPAGLSFILHSQFVLPDVVLQKGDCPICVEMRASAMQASAGCFFPAILAHVGALSIAQKYITYDIPYITQEPKKMFKLMQKQSKPVVNMFFVLFIGQALLASTVTYFEAKSVYAVNAKLIEVENLIENT